MAATEEDLEFDEVEEEVKEPEVVPKENYENVQKAMSEERHRRKEAEKAYREQQERLSKLEGRYEVLNQIYGEKEEEIDPQEKLARDVAAQKEDNQKTRAELEALRSANALSGQESSFQAEHPDYPKARQHYYDARIASLKALGYDDDTAYQKTVQEVVELAQSALQTGDNAAERVYKASMSLGYQSVSKPAEDKLKSIEEGQSGGMPRGTPPTGGLTLEAIDKMTDEQFAELTEDQLRSALGG